MKHYTIPVFIPELACPFQCVFCNQNKISGQYNVPDPEQINEIIDKHLHTIDHHNNHVEIGFFGGSFTGIQLSDQVKYLKVAKKYIDQGKVRSIRLSTRPDYINEEDLEILKKYGVGTIELGAQSMDEGVLMKSGRGHTVADTEKASEMIQKKGLIVGLQMMIGLPGDTLEKSLYTARRIIELGADNTRIYPALVIRGTVLEAMYKDRKYIPLTIDEAVKWTKEIFPVFEDAGIKVLRIGLHPSDGLITGDELVAGPFHVSFRELVLSALWLDELKRIKNIVNEGITIHVPEGQYNYAIGYQAINKKYLLRTFACVKFKADSSLLKREYYVDYH